MALEYQIIPPEDSNIITKQGHCTAKVNVFNSFVVFFECKPIQARMEEKSSWS